MESSGAASSRIQSDQPTPWCQYFWYVARFVPRAKTSTWPSIREMTDGAPMIWPPSGIQSLQPAFHARCTSCPSVPRCQTLSTFASCELTAGPPVALPPSASQPDQPAPGWKYR